MSITVGIDIGGSNIKIAALDRSGALVAASLLDAASLNLEPELERLQNIYRLEIQSIALTGVGAYRAADRLLGLSPVPIHEFTAIGLGGLTVSGLSEALVVSMGTGTAFLHAKSGSYRHILGSGIGGGTLTGLCRLLLGTDKIEEIEALCKKGDAGRVDLTMGEITQGTLPSLASELTASNFASIKPDASETDTAMGVMNLVLQGVGTMSILAAQVAGVRDIILTGAMAGAGPAKKTYALFEKTYGYQFHIPKNAVYATAIGAALDLTAVSVQNLV